MLDAAPRGRIAGQQTGDFRERGKRGREKYLKNHDAGCLNTSRLVTPSRLAHDTLAVFPAMRPNPSHSGTGPMRRCWGHRPLLKCDRLATARPANNGLVSCSRASILAGGLEPAAPILSPASAGPRIGSTVSGPHAGWDTVDGPGCLVREIIDRTPLWDTMEQESEGIEILGADAVMRGRG